MADYEIDEIQSEKTPWFLLAVIALVLWIIAYLL